MVGLRHVLLLMGLLVLNAAAGPDDFMRVAEDDTAVRLQTAITRYEKDGVTVDLIGAIHIGDRAYYQKLNSKFENYEVLLFEMVGGERLGGKAHRPPPAPADQPAPASPPGPGPGPQQAEDDPHPAAAKPAAGADGNDRGLAALGGIYGTVSRLLGLSGQSDLINYHAGNFVHADLTVAEFNQLQRERGESLLGFALKAAQMKQDPENAPNSFRLLKALVVRNPNLLKLEIVRTLGDAGSQLAVFSGENVIIGDRNQRCLEVMNRQIAAGRKNLAIFYGAAHFPDMEERLVEQGFKRVNHEWLTAWFIPKPPKPAKPQPAS